MCTWCHWHMCVCGLLVRGLKNILINCVCSVWNVQCTALSRFTYFGISNYFTTLTFERWYPVTDVSRQLVGVGDVNEGRVLIGQLTGDPWLGLGDQRAWIKATQYGQVWYFEWNVNLNKTLTKLSAQSAISEIFHSFPLHWNDHKKPKVS